MPDSFPFSHAIVLALFALAAGLTVVGALIAALSTRIIRGVSGLMIACVGLAGLYVFLHSPFLALMEILIYVGAVCVTIVFGVMLSEPDEPADGGSPHGRAMWTAGALIVSAVAFCGCAWLSLQGPWTAPASLVTDGSIHVIGVELLTTYSLPFELISLVLLVAILGALVLARTGRTKE